MPFAGESFKRKIYSKSFHLFNLINSAKKNPQSKYFIDQIGSIVIFTKY